ncbi:MAG: PDGLE domain-containing protein, partial [Desulfuromonadales bacterium]
EGLVTAAVLAFLLRAQPEILAAAPDTGRSSAIPSLKKVMVALLVATALTGGVLSWFASERPDGLEWSIARASGSEEFHGPRGEMHRSLEQVQQGTAMLPDYALRDDGAPAEAGTSLSGLVGGAATLVLTGVFAVALRRRGQGQSG